MAKKKSAKSDATKATTVAKKIGTSPAKSAARPLSNEQIGQVAGEVWHLLAAGGEHTVASVRKAIEAPADLVTASLGWLAREGKLDFLPSGRSIKLRLR